MAKDVIYTNGVIAVKENSLLKDKIYKLCESDAEEALRVISESGFGRGADVSEGGIEQLLQADERDLDEFIREYSPSQVYTEFLLCPRDFHNAKAIVKAECTGIPTDGMLAPEGLIPIGKITECIQNEDFSALGQTLGEATQKAYELFKNEEKLPSGAEIGVIFEKALFVHLKKICAHNAMLKRLITQKADLTNILTAMRAESAEAAKKYYVEGGKLSHEFFAKLFSEEKEAAAKSIGGEYGNFVRLCLDLKSERKPLTEAERILESLETDFLAKNKYELKNAQPFLYYVLRRRAENTNVRILFVCLSSGMPDYEIKKRLRTF